MAKCLKCGAEICNLKIRSIDYGTLEIDDENGDLNYEWISDLYGDQQKGIEFRCPQCGELLFTDYEEAEDFLKQKPAKP